MTYDFETMVSDYFLVYDAIENLAPKLFENFEFWETDFTKLSVCTAEGLKKYDCIEAAKMFFVPESSMLNFLVVNCCLSNNLNILINDRDYESWCVKDNQLIVLFKDKGSESFDGAEIVELLCKTQKTGWSYANLLNVDNSIE